MNENIKIEDNFLPQETFTEIQNIFLCGIQTQNENIFIPWRYVDTIDTENDVDKFQFIHVFYMLCSPAGQSLMVIKPILDIINPVSLFRIKSNLLTKTSTIIKNNFHVDMGFQSEEKGNQWTTSIFYLNTNNGYTEFQDGRISMENTKVESVANRMVTFPTNLRHRGTSCTDEKTRVVINFNYYDMI